MKQRITVQQKTENDTEWIKEILTAAWSSPKIATRGKIYNALDFPSLVARIDKQRLGLLVYRFDQDSCEILALNSLKENLGIGIRLLSLIERVAKKYNCKRLWLITTNNNLHALQFYKNRGYRLRATYKNSVEELRKLKPEIPLADDQGVPIKDELEFEKKL